MSELRRRLLAEFLGSLVLAAVVVGSGIAAQRLSPADVGLQLLENAAATALGLYAIILVVGPVSGAHLNPVVSFVDAAFGHRSWRDAFAYLPAQTLGCTAGAVLANLMFDRAALSLSTHHRLTGPHVLSEAVATAGLVCVVFALARSDRGALAPAAVGAYIGAAYFFTSSTSFANPAITVGRMFSNTFAGIAPASAPGFIAAQCVGGAVGFGLLKLLYPAGIGSAPAARTGRHPDGLTATVGSRPVPPVVPAEAALLGQVPARCTLSPAAAAERVARWRELDRHVTARSRTAGSLRVEFAPEAAAELGALVAAENSCCAHLSWRLDVVVTGSDRDLDQLNVTTNVPRTPRRRQRNAT